MDAISRDNKKRHGRFLHYQLCSISSMAASCNYEDMRFVCSRD